MTRRDFLSVAAASPAAAAARSAAPHSAAPAPQAMAASALALPAKRLEPGLPLPRLGYDAYSIRDLKWKDLQHIDYAVSLGLDAVQLSIPDDFASVEPDHLKKVRDYAAAKGIELSAGTGCICPTNPAWNPAHGSPEQYLAAGGAVAHALGLTALRVFIGAPTDRHGNIPIQTHIDSTLKVLRNARSRMQDLGLRIAIENHGDLTARELLALIGEAGADQVGVNYDAGNPMWVMEDPAQTLELLAPFVVTSHFRDSALFEHPRGAAFQWVAMGDGSIDISAVVESYRRLCPGKPLLLEIITGRPPQLLPYLEDEWWNGFRTTPAADFARFIGLVRRGHAYLGPMVIGAPGQHSDTLAAALREQQRLDLERSLSYCRETLKLGLRARA